MSYAAPLPHVGLLLQPGYVLTAEQGTYAVSGQDADLRYTGPLAANQGSYTVSGQDAGLLVGYRLVCDVGFYVQSGQPALFNVGTSRGDNAAPLPHLGSLLGLPSGFSYTLTADPGIYTITGSESLADFELVAAQGSYTITGQDAALIRTCILVCDQGSYAISGQDADFAIGAPNRVLTAEQGTYSITGQDAGLFAGFKVSAEHGFYAHQGQAANLAVGALTHYSMLAEPGSYALFGNDALFVLGDPVLWAEAGYYSIEGFSVISAPTRTRHAASGPRKRNYIVKGKRYHNITEEELALIIATEQAIERADVIVSHRNKKPHMVSKDAFETLLDTVSKLPKPTKSEISDDDQDIEEILALL